MRITLAQPRILSFLLTRVCKWPQRMNLHRHARTFLTRNLGSSACVAMTLAWTRTFLSYLQFGANGIRSTHFGSVVNGLERTHAYILRTGLRRSRPSVGRGVGNLAKTPKISTPTSSRMYLCAQKYTNNIIIRIIIEYSQPLPPNLDANKKFLKSGLSFSTKYLFTLSK